MRIVLVGEEGAGRLALQAAVAAGAVPVCVLTSPRSPLAVRAAALGIPVLPSDMVRDPALAGRLYDLGTDILLNVHSLHRISGPVTRAPRVGAFNLHPGPLPAYAGLNAPSWAILNGETEHAATLHWMDADIDAGAIAYEARFAIGPADTALQVGMRCVEYGIPLIERLIDDARRSPAAIPRLRQERSRRHYYGRSAADAGRLDWNRPAAYLERLVRAFDYAPMPSPWGRLTAWIGPEEVEIRKIALTGFSANSPPGTIRREAGLLLVAAADEWIRILRASAPPAAQAGADA